MTLLCAPMRKSSGLQDTALKNTSKPYTRQFRLTKNWTSLSTSIEHGRRLLGGDAQALSDLKQRLKELSKQKASLLCQNGFSADYLSPVYECAQCSDTGYIDGRKCNCFREAEINMIYEQSHIKNLLKTEKNMYI